MKRLGARAIWRINSYTNCWRKSMRIWLRKRANCADLHEHVFEFSAILSNDIGIETAQLQAPRAARHTTNRRLVGTTIARCSQQSEIFTHKITCAARVAYSLIGCTAPRTASFAALATRNLTTVLAGILIFCCVLGLKPVRAFLFCFTSLPKPGKTNSPSFLIAL